MQETAVLVVIEVVSVKDPEGLKVYQELASKLIGPLGGAVLAVGGKTRGRGTWLFYYRGSTLVLRRRFPRLDRQRSLQTPSRNLARERHDEGGDCSDQRGSGPLTFTHRWRRSVRARQLAVTDATCLKNASAGSPCEP